MTDFTAPFHAWLVQHFGRLLTEEQCRLVAQQAYQIAAQEQGPSIRDIRQIFDEYEMDATALADLERIRRDGGAKLTPEGEPQRRRDAEEGR